MERNDVKMNVEIVRDGLVLRGRIDKVTDVQNAALIIFHGFGGDSGYGEGDLYSIISKKAMKCGVITVRFDYSGYGKSEGHFTDMDIFREMLDAIAILNYVRSLPYVTDIYLLGHSQGGVIAGMLAGLYPDIVKKLILLAAASTLKEDAIKGICMGTKYDTNHIPDIVLVDGQHNMGGHYFRIAKNLPIYEMTSKYVGETLIIHGIPDVLVDYHASVKYHDCMANSKLCLYENLDHSIEGEDQSNVLEEIVNFLNAKNVAGNYLK